MKRLSLEDQQKLAEKRGGKCLSETYVNSEKKLLWECAKGHRWEATPGNVKNNESWCPYCAENLLLTIADAQKLVKKRGGKCLSETYVGNKALLKWQCRYGHEWLASFNTIMRGSWCPDCSTGVGERICRAFFEQLFDKPFPKTRPKWLISANKTKLELDGFCEELGLAFEHQGEQHYTVKASFHLTKQEVINIQARDRLKQQLCAQNGVVLFVIPQIGKLVPIVKLRPFIGEKCEHEGIPLPEGFYTKEVDLYDAYASFSEDLARRELEKIAAEHDGKLLTRRYKGAFVKLLWECKEGHRFESKPSVVKNGHWCPDCGGSKRLTIADMHEIAKERSGKCLSSTYLNNRMKLKWECAKGHQWEATPRQTKNQVHWCPYCAGTKRLTIGEMHQLAAKQGGKCLSSTYLNNRTKLKWECAKGHQWEANAHDVKGGRWCPVCAGRLAGRKVVGDIH